MSATDWSGVDMGEALPTGTVTLLLADVEGSTQLWDTQSDTMTFAVSALDRTVSELIAEHRGVRPVEQGEGDSFVAAFARASDAVACALALQCTDLAPLRLRIGVHTGEVQLRDEGNYAGSTINKAARLRDLAHGGQTLLSGATEEVVAERLPNAAWVTDLGVQGLRGLSRPVRVWQLDHPRLSNDFPPLRTGRSTVFHSLPVQLTSFVGRTGSLVDMGRLVVNDRLVTLTGAGGAGKTRLAIEVAAQLPDAFPDGIWWADLAPVTHPEVTPVAIARALGLPDRPGRSITETVFRHVRERNMLLILDNCEHLLEASAAFVEDLLRSSVRVHVLATSREPLLVPGEVTWQVPSLSLPDEAIELFCDRARQARPPFTLTDADIGTVTEICRRLDGMPLAIELAAARVRTLSLDEILDSLHDRFRLLTGGARTAVRRQQTLRASVDWSHALLTSPERALFRRLAVFTGGFDIEAARALAGDSDVERYQVLDQLGLLADKSLLNVDNTGHATRYRLLETVRQYALEKLGESGEADAIRDRHRDHYTEMAARLDAPARGESDRMINQTETEFDNLRSAFIWSIENGATTSAVRLATSLQPLWLGRGRMVEGLAWLDAAVGGVGEMDPAVRARALADRVTLSSWVDISDGLAPALECLAIAQQADDPALLLRALAACVAITAHDVGAAEPYLGEAIELARSSGDSWRLSQILGRKAYGEFMTGDLAGMKTSAAEGCALADAVGDGFTSRQCRAFLASGHIYAGHLGEALDLLAGLGSEAVAAHDPMSTMVSAQMRVIALAHRGDTAAARAGIDDMMRASAEFDGVYDYACHAIAALVCIADGDRGSAWDAVESAIGHTLNPPAEMLNKVWLTEVALACGHHELARDWADETVPRLDGAWVALQLDFRARAHILAGDLSRAAADGYEALRLAQGMRIDLAIPDMLETVAGLACEAGSHQEAARLLGAADARRQAMGTSRFRGFDDHHASLVEAVRRHLGDEDFEVCSAHGAALSVDEAVGYAERGRGERRRPATGWDSLTPAELDVVRLVADGIPNKDIATRLFVSPRTVQSHLRHVYHKMGLTSRVQLAQEAARHHPASS